MRPSTTVRRVSDACLLVSAAMAVVAALTVAGCAKKASPRAPQLVRPRAIDDLAASPVRHGIRLTWTRPTTTVDGRSMPDLDGIMITRAIESPATPSTQERVFEHIATIHLDDRMRFDKVRRMSFDDRNVSPGEVYLYQVTAFTFDRYFSVPSAAARARWAGPPGAARPEE